MKILIVILSANLSPWDKLTDTIENTWGSFKNKNVEIIYYYGDKDKAQYGPILEKNKLYLNHDETFENIGRKTIEMFDYIIKHFKFDYILRTNSSSYINQDMLEQFLYTKERENYAGAVIGNHHGINFLSGAGYVLSRDVVELVLKHKNKWDHSYIDDVALGLLLSGFKNIKFNSHLRIDINNPNNVYIDKNVFHYRCKCANRDDDIKIMNSLHEKYNNI